MPDIKEEIICMLDKIENTDILWNIAELCKDSMPITLNQYIQSEYGEYSFSVRKQISDEVKSLLNKIKRTTKVNPESNYIDHYTDLYIDGYPIDIWIGERYTIIHPWRLANIIFKIWCGEIILKD